MSICCALLWEAGGEWCRNSGGVKVSVAGGAAGLSGAGLPSTWRLHKKYMCIAITLALQKHLVRLPEVRCHSEMAGILHMTGWFPLISGPPSARSMSMLGLLTFWTPPGQLGGCNVDCGCILGAANRWRCHGRGRGDRPKTAICASIPLKCPFSCNVEALEGTGCYKIKFLKTHRGHCPFLKPLQIVSFAVATPVATAWQGECKQRLFPRMLSQWRIRIFARTHFNSARILQVAIGMYFLPRP